MPSWEEMNAASISAFRSVVNDVGNTYQQVLFGNSGYQRQDISRDLARSTVNPEYLRAEQAYSAQEQEREYLAGIGVDDYQPTALDWQAYGHYSAAWEKENPDPRLTGSDLDAPEYER